MNRFRRLLTAAATSILLATGFTVHHGPLQAFASGLSVQSAISTINCSQAKVLGDFLSAGTPYTISAINTTSDAAEGASDGALNIYFNATLIQSYTDFNVLHTFTFTPSTSGSFSACDSGDGDETGVVSLPDNDCSTSPTATASVSGATVTFTVTGVTQPLGNPDPNGTPIYPFKTQNIGTIAYNPSNTNGQASIQASFTKANPSASASIGFAAFASPSTSPGLYCASLIDPRYNHVPERKAGAAAATSGAYPQPGTLVN